MSSKIDTAMKVVGGLIIAAFFLPFFSITCNGMEIAHVTGFTLVKGGEPGGMIADSSKRLGPKTDTKGSKEKDSKYPVEPNGWAIAAFALAIIGFGVSFVKDKQARIGNVAIAGLGMAALIMLWINVTGKAGELDPKKKKKEDSAQVAKDGPPTRLSRQLEREVKIEVGSAIGFWAASILFITVGVLGFKRLKAGEAPARPGGGIAAGGAPPSGGQPPGAHPPSSGQPPNA